MDSDFKKATQRVFHPGDRPSRIEVFVKPSFLDAPRPWA